MLNSPNSANYPVGVEEAAGKLKPPKEATAEEVGAAVGAVVLVAPNPKPAERLGAEAGVPAASELKEKAGAFAAALIGQSQRC